MSSTKFYLSLPRAWWRGLRCGNCRRLRSLGFWEHPWAKFPTMYFCAECLGDMVASAEGKLKLMMQAKGRHP